MQLEQRDRVSRGRRTWHQAVVERQPVRANRIGEMARLVITAQQVDKFGIMGSSDDHVIPGIAGISQQFAQHRFTCGDSLDGVGAPEQLVKQEQVRFL